jgi:F-type H+-transporting ATPase subunit alpha
VAGDLKLAYAQFEELETFARFGARLDEDTRKIIEHGRRIRACLKQPEFAPVSVPAQIAILLALTANLFDPVPIEQMTDADRAVRDAAAQIPAEVCARFETADKLSEEDRKTIIEIARKALAPLQPKPEAKPKPDQKTEKKSELEAKAGNKSGPKPNKPTLESESKPEQKAESKPDGGSKPEAQTKPKPESKTGPESKPESEPKAEAKPDGESQSQAKPETEPRPKPEPESKPSAPTEPRPKPEPKSKEKS